jgi:hypothetical protein
VEIPGQVLSTGTYVFKLADSQAERNLLQVSISRSGPKDLPEAVRAWFYPGDNYGHEVVYPKAVVLAKANKHPVASMPDELAVHTTKPIKTMAEPEAVALKQTPLKAQKPTEEEVEIPEVYVPAAEPAPAPKCILPVTLCNAARIVLGQLLLIIPGHPCGRIHRQFS